METSFEKFWRIFDNKKSRDKCERKWYSMSAKNQIACLESLPAYIKSTPDRQFRKHPATYLNNKSWNDKIYSKGEETVLYKESPQPTLSDYVPKKFERATGINHMREKLRSNYENGIYIKDWGNIYTNILTQKCAMSVPESVKQQIEQEVHEEATRTRNRFEPQYTGNIDSDIRDKILNFYLNDCKSKRVKLWKLI